MLGAAAVAWGALLVAHVTGVAGHLHHDAVIHAGAEATAVGQFLAGWLVMVVAMMLPFVAPSLRRAPTKRSGASFVVGFLLAWSLAGAVLLAFDAGVHATVHAVPALEARPSLIAAAVLALAAAVQLAPATAAHLVRCTVAWSRWDGGGGRAFAGGGEYGRRCMRADGPLMLVMFAAGGGMAWMALMALAMAAERRSNGGRRVIRGAGVALLVAAAVTAFVPGGLPGPLHFGD